MESLSPVKPSITNSSSTTEITPVEEDQKIGVLDQIDSLRSQINDETRSLNQAQSELSDSGDSSSVSMTVTQPTQLAGDDVRIIDGDVNEDLYIADGEKVQINGNVNGNIFMGNNANIHIKGDFTGDAYMNSNNNFAVDGDTEAFVVANYQNNIAFNGEFTAAKNNYTGGMDMNAKTDEGQNVRFKIKGNREHAAGVYMNAYNNTSFKKDIKSHIRGNQGNNIQGQNLQGSAMLNEKNNLDLKSVTGNIQVNIDNQVAIKENYTQQESDYGPARGVMRSNNGYVANNENGYVAGRYNSGSSTNEERQARQQQLREAMMSIGFSESEIADLESQEDSAESELSSIEDIIKQKLSEANSEKTTTTETEGTQEQEETANVAETDEVVENGEVAENTTAQAQSTQETNTESTESTESVEDTAATNSALRSKIISSSGNKE